MSGSFSFFLSSLGNSARSCTRRRTQLREHVEVYLALARVAVHQVLAREELPYFTENGHYLEATREAWLGHYKEVRRLRNGNPGTSVGLGPASPGYPHKSTPAGGPSRAGTCILPSLYPAVRTKSLFLRGARV